MYLANELLSFIFCTGTLKSVLEQFDLCRFIFVSTVTRNSMSGFHHSSFPLCSFPQETRPHRASSPDGVRLPDCDGLHRPGAHTAGSSQLWPQLLDPLLQWWVEMFELSVTDRWMTQPSPVLSCPATFHLSTPPSAVMMCQSDCTWTQQQTPAAPRVFAARLMTWSSSGIFH